MFYDDIQRDFNYQENFIFMRINEYSNIYIVYDKEEIFKWF